MQQYHLLDNTYHVCYHLFMDENQYINPEDIAKMLGITVNSVYRYMKLKDNPLPHYKLTDRNFVVKLTEFESWMDSRLVK